MTRFTFNKDSHTPTHSMLGLHYNTKGFVATVEFDERCVQQTMLGLPWNKLCGVSYNTLPWYDKEKNRLEKLTTEYKDTFIGNIKAWFKSFSPGHHKNSLRLGWRANKGAIDIGLYMYVDKRRIMHRIVTLVPNERQTILVKVEAEAVFWSLDNGNTYKAMPVSTKSFKGLGYYLKPYFGGLLPAPNDMSLLLNFKPL